MLDALEDRIPNRPHIILALLEHLALRLGQACGSVDDSDGGLIEAGARLHELLLALRRCCRPESRGRTPIYRAFSRLQELGLARETTGRQRGRINVYDEYLKSLNAGTAGA